MSERTPGAMKEVNREVIMNAKETVPEGEHWVVSTVMKSELTVSKGAKLTVQDSLMKSKVSVDDGGEFELEGVNMKSEVVHGSAAQNPEQGGGRSCPACGQGVSPEAKFCGQCGVTLS
jgi:hypothetical protein